MHPSAHIIPLPSAAATIVQQQPRRGRYPANVSRLFSPQRPVVATPKIVEPDTAEQALEKARGFYLTCKMIHDEALCDLRRAQQAAGCPAEVLQLPPALQLVSPPSSAPSTRLRGKA